MRTLGLLVAALVGYVVGTVLLLVWGGKQLFEGTAGAGPIDDEFYENFGLGGGGYFGSAYDDRD